MGDHAVVMEVSCNDDDDEEEEEEEEEDADDADGVVVMIEMVVVMIEMVISAIYHHTYHYHYHLYQINSYIQLLICTQQHLLYITIITIFITICCRVGDGGSIYLQCDRKCMSTYMH